MTKDIYKNKVDFAQQEFSTELAMNTGKPKPRESKSQKAQASDVPKRTLRDDKKIPMNDKLN